MDRLGFGFRNGLGAILFLRKPATPGNNLDLKKANKREFQSRWEYANS